MKILFIGDIFGKGGRRTVKEILGSVKKRLNPDLVLANAENLSHGNGFSVENIEEMKKAGIDFFTTGNHVWDNSDGVAHLDDPKFPVIRPANFPPKNVPGRGYEIVKAHNGANVLVVNLMGRVFMKKDFDCPFRAAEKILKETKNLDFAAIIVDFHAETTSEKYALGYFLDGKVSAVIGTHTHVQTNDARIFENGTAYISDVGMTGPFDSIIGLNKESAIQMFLTQMPIKQHPENEGKMAFSAVIIEVDEKNKKALNIEHILEFI